MPEPSEIDALVAKILQCQACRAHLPFAPNPVLRAGSGSAKLLVIGQAPGTKVHGTNIPWNDPSGERLRHWLGMDRDQFYDDTRIAIMPMGFCYPGRGKSGDLPPRTECAPLWHEKVRQLLPDIKLTLLIGQYAQRYYLKEQCKPTLTETVKAWRDYIPDGYMPLVHPSPRNNIWLKKNPWFEEEVVPFLKAKAHEVM